MSNGVHTLNCIDSFGDGWHGGYLTIDGTNYCTGFTSGKLQTATIQVGVFEGFTGKGQDYRGVQTHTVNGATCQSWSSQYPHSHDRTPSNYPSAGLTSNYCRNPDGESTIWCYTTGSTRWDYCMPTSCAAAGTGMTGDGSDYRGCKSTTKSGYQCMAWTSQSPHSHTRTPSNYPASGLTSNYCRNPDGSSTIWCYTTSSSKRWEACDP